MAASVLEVDREAGYGGRRAGSAAPGPPRVSARRVGRMRHSYHPLRPPPRRFLPRVWLVLALAIIPLGAEGLPRQQERAGASQLRSARVTILSTMLADTRGIGE